MTLRQKFVAAFAGVAAGVAVLVGFVSFSATAHAQTSEINRSLAAAATTLSSGGTLASGAAAPGTVTIGADQGDHGRGSDEGIVQTAQAVSTTGAVTQLSGTKVDLPIDDRVLTLAKAGATAGDRLYRTVTVDGTSYQVLTQALGGKKGAIQVARNLDEAARILQRLAIVNVLVGLAVLLVAGVAGWLVARQITRRLTNLTAVAERVSSTGQLDVRIATKGRDEVGRLSTSLQSMLDELSASKEAQQRLVQNAGHELRTPLTSLRTNVSVLRRFDELSADSRIRLLDDVEGETRELTHLVDELVELATDRHQTEEVESVDLAALAEQVAATFRRRSGRRITVEAESAEPVTGRRNALERAVSNLLDNALKFDPDSADPLEIRICGGQLLVLDRGPGFSKQDAERIFDRFYRADAARSLPGSGLGLAIVLEVATMHGGTVAARSRPNGGAIVGFTIGQSEPSADAEPSHS